MGSVPVFLLLLLALPAWALDHRDLALVVNTQDPLSVEIGEYYALKRGITFQNVVKVAFAPKSSLTREEFETLKKEIDSQLRPHVQALAIAWAAPWKVECMSITSAFAFGFNPASCSWGCKPTPTSRYFASATRRPFAALGIRPAMLLAASSIEDAKALIDRGERIPRPVAQNKLAVRILEQQNLTYRTDVLFYFTGTARVGGLETVRFLPGAIADHLTSSGGALTDRGGQMSAMEWLEAGATGSYGTVVEPCNLPQKFPHPAVAIGHYLAGETLIEAYWKSVRMPGQGVFVGEPLAAPFARKTD